MRIFLIILLLLLGYEVFVVVGMVGFFNGGVRGRGMCGCVF